MLVRLKAIKAVGNLTHDLVNDKRPSYVDRNKSDQNVIILGDDFLKAREKFNEQVDSIKESFNDHKDQQRSLILRENLSSKEYQQQRRNIRNWQSHMNTHLSGLIAFGKDANANQLDRKEMDNNAKNYLLDFCSSHNVETLYLVRHEDEATVHYHFVTTNYDDQLYKTLSFDRNALRKEQDAIGVAFESMGLKRGLDKQARLKQVAERLELELVDGKYDPEVWSQANVIHRSVKQLHEDLPLELASLQDKKISAEDDYKIAHGLQKAENIVWRAAEKKRIDEESVLKTTLEQKNDVARELKELNDEIAKQENKKAKNERYMQNAQKKYDKLKDNFGVGKDKLDKLKKNVLLYEDRAQTAKNEIERLSSNTRKLKLKTVEVVTGYEAGPSSGKQPIITKKKMVETEEAMRFQKQATAVYLENRQKQVRAKKELEAKALKNLQDKEEMESYFAKQAYKYLLVFGKPIDSTSEMIGFIRWHEQETGWTTTKLGARFKVQKENDEVIRVVVESNKNLSDREKAETLLYAVTESGMKRGHFKGSNEVLLELWTLLETDEHSFELALTDEQRVLLEASGAMEDELEFDEPVMEDFQRYS